MREKTLLASPFNMRSKDLKYFPITLRYRKTFYITVFTHWKKKRKALLLAKCIFYILDLQMVDLSFKNVKIFMFFIADTWHNRANPVLTIFPPSSNDKTILR